MSVESKVSETRKLDSRLLPGTRKGPDRFCRSPLSAAGAGEPIQQDACPLDFHIKGRLGCSEASVAVWQPGSHLRSMCSASHHQNRGFLTHLPREIYSFQKILCVCVRETPETKQNKTQPWILGVRWDPLTSPAHVPPGFLPGMRIKWGPGSETLKTRCVSIFSFNHCLQFFKVILWIQ